jgi:hypothetical protein
MDDGHQPDGASGSRSAADNRRRMIVRALPALLLLYASLVFLHYGAAFHKKTVLVPQEKKPAAKEIPPAFLM